MQGLSKEQEEAQMGMWALFAAPLLMSTDLRELRNESRAVLLNREAIAINQDPAGINSIVCIHLVAHVRWPALSNPATKYRLVKAQRP